MRVELRHLTTLPSWSTTELAAMLLDDKVDLAIVGVRGEADPPLPTRLSWHEVANAPVVALVSSDHPAAGQPEASLTELADAQWAATPGDSCLSSCFAAACAQAGFTPRPILETDIGGCIDLVRGGDAAALCQPTFRETHGVVAVPLADTPLRWRHLLGWRPDSPSARNAEMMVGLAAEAYADAVARSAAYLRWLARP